jgi:hypothetical protein
MSPSLRIKGTVNGVETIYIGSNYEKDGSTIKTYFYAGGPLFNIPTLP